MCKRALLIIVILSSIIFVGCNEPVPGTTRSLGMVSYETSFAAAKETISQYFSVESVDPQAGIIKARPQDTETAGERLLGGSPARQTATLTLTREDGQVVAHLSIAIQRQGSAVFRTAAQPSEDYSSVPNRSPAEEAAATTPEQNEAWQTQRYDHAMERQILDDLYNSLHPMGTEKLKADYK